MITIGKRHDVTPSQAPILVGSLIISKILIRDESEFGEREAGPGEVGEIVRVQHGNTPLYQVAFFPSGIHNVWTESEIRRDGDLLPVGDPRRPLRSHIDAVRVIDNLIDSTNTSLLNAQTVLVVPPDQLAVAIQQLDRAIADLLATGVALNFGEQAKQLDDVLKVLTSLQDGKLPILSASQVNSLASKLGIAERMPVSPTPGRDLVTASSIADRGNPVQRALDALIADLSAERANPHAADSPACTKDEVIYWHADQVRTVMQAVGRFVQTATKAVADEMSAEQQRAIELVGPRGHDFAAPSQLAADLYSGLQSAVAGWAKEVEENCHELRRINDEEAAPRAFSTPEP